MKTKMLVIFVIGFSWIGTTWADVLPPMGYSVRLPFKDLAPKGYRWITANGPYACPTEQEVRQIISAHSDLAELNMVEQGAYFLIPGTLVQVIRDDPTNGMSEILLGGITKPLWTYTKFLSARPIRNIYGIVETPNTGGLIDPADAYIAGETGGNILNERAQARTR